MDIPHVSFRLKQDHFTHLDIIELQSLAERKNLTPDPTRPHRVGFFAFIYIEEGIGQHMVDFETYTYQPGSMIFIQREQVHSFDFSSGAKGKIILFTQAFLDQVHANMRLPHYTPTHLSHSHCPLVQLSTAYQRRVDSYVDHLSQELAAEKPDTLMAMYLFSALALMVNRHREHDQSHTLSNEHSNKLARFIELMQAHYRATRDANWYAGKINTTYKTLNHVCKLATGLTAKQMIDAFTVMEMKRELVLSNCSSQQLAYEFGFEDASNFVKYFRNLTKQTPTQFQKQFIAQ